MVEAVDVPVTVKMRRGLEERVARRARARAEARGGRAWPSLTLHPRSAKQMYTGTADHTLTAELVERGVRPRYRVGRHRRPGEAPSACSTTTGAAAVMVGRGAQGQPWTLQEMAERGAERPSRARSSPS